MLKRLVIRRGVSSRNGYQEKGFSLIELIVVIAIIGVLVMLATPKFLGYVERAELKRIQHDVKVMEGKMEEGMIHDTEEFLSWDDNIKDLRLLVVAKQLFDTEGVARKVDKLSSLRFGPTASLEGVPSTLSHTEGEHRDYKVIPTNMKKHIKSSLPGTFYSNINGKVYYEHNKPLKSAEEEIVLRCEAPKPLDYTFDHLTGTIIKYHGNLQHLIIPATFEVDGVCWPVRIIGKGAFQIGNYTGPEEEEPIKSVIIPPSVEKIEEDAFKGNELENVEIPPSVEEIEKDAFKDNKIPNKPEEGSGGPGGAVIKKEPEDIEIDDSAFDNNGPNGDEKIEPSFEPSTDKDLDVTINIKTDKDGDKFGSIGDYNGGGTSIVIPPTIIVDGEKVPVKEIEDGAFQGKGLITVGLPFGLERIEDYAFAGNQLIATIIPETVIHIGNYAFAFNEVRHTRNSKITKDTIKSIIIQADEYIKALDKVGNIASGGVKVDMVKDKTRLLDNIYVTSNSNVVIDTGGFDDDVDIDEDDTDSLEVTAIKNILKIIDNEIKNIKNSPSDDIEIQEVEDIIDNVQKSINSLPVKNREKLQTQLNGFKIKIENIKNIKNIKNDLKKIRNLISDLDSDYSNTNIHNIETLISRTQLSINLLSTEDGNPLQIDLNNSRYTLDKIKEDKKDEDKETEVIFHGLTPKAFDGNSSTYHSGGGQVTWDGNLDNRVITITSIGRPESYKPINQPVRVVFYNSNNQALMSPGESTLSVEIARASKVTSKIIVPKGASSMNVSRYSFVYDISAPKHRKLPKEVSGLTYESTNSTIKLSWEQDETDYEKVAIYRNNEFVDYSTGTTYTDKYFYANTTHNYKVIAINTTGNASNNGVELLASTNKPEVIFRGLSPNAFNGDMKTNHSGGGTVTWDGDLDNKVITIVANGRPSSYRPINEPVFITFYNSKSESLLSLNIAKDRIATSEVVVPKGATSMVVSQYSYIYDISAP